MSRNRIGRPARTRAFEWGALAARRGGPAADGGDWWERQPPARIRRCGSAQNA